MRKTFKNMTLVLTLALCSSVALAFPQLVTSQPRVGWTVHQVPHQVRLQMSQALYPEKTWIKVYASDGQRVDTRQGGIRADDPEVLETALLPLNEGIYHVLWQVCAKACHFGAARPMVGDFKFKVAR